MVEFYIFLQFDEVGLEVVCSYFDEGVVMLVYGFWCDDIVKLFNGVLVIELVCVLCYCCYYFMVDGLELLVIVEEFFVYVNVELGYVDCLVQCIVQLGGDLDFNFVGLLDCSYVGYDEVDDLKVMICFNFVVECVVVEIYWQMICFVVDKDLMMCCLFEDIFVDEEEYVDELKDWMVCV